MWALYLVSFTLGTVAQAQYISSDRHKLARQNPASLNREIYLASHDDFCIFGPTQPDTTISQSGEDVVSWCSKGDHGTRVIPAGTLQGVTYIKAQNWVQVSGVGDFTKINIKPGDWGGQFDSGDHKPDGAKVFGGSDKKEASSWVTLVSADVFCFRACFGDPAFCPTDFADQGCYTLFSEGVGPAGTFQSCTSEDGLPPAQQGDSAPEWRDCQGAPLSSNGDAGRPTTSWAPVQTCIPCTDASAPASSTAPPSSAETSVTSPATSQQGITRLNGTDGAGAVNQVPMESGVPSFISAPVSSPTGQSNGALILRRAEETTTSNGQCCFTTYTPTVVGAAAGPTVATTSPVTIGTGASAATTGTAILSGGSMIASTGNSTGTALLTNSTSTTAHLSSTTNAFGAANTARPSGNGTTAGNSSSGAGHRAVAGLPWPSPAGQDSVLAALGQAAVILGAYALL